MSDQGRFSIVKSEPALDSWYHATLDRNASLRGTVKSAMEEVLFFDVSKSNQVNYPSGAANDWFYGPTKGENVPIGTNADPVAVPSLRSTGNGFVLPGLESSWLTSDKPLPPVPITATPYFDYIFANAGIESQVNRGKYSPDNVSFEVDNDAIEHERPDDDDAPSPNDVMPRTPDYSQGAIVFDHLEEPCFTTHEFLQAGISITSEELVDNYPAAANNNSRSCVNPTDEAEKNAASVGFFGGFAVEESPSPYHVPITDDSSGFGDIRDGAEDFPQQWQDNVRRPKRYTLEEADAKFVDYCMDTASDFTKSVLVPRSRKLVSVEKQHGHGRSPVVIDLTNDDRSGHGSNNTGKKRKAHDSFVTKSFFDISSVDEEVPYLYTKKARVISKHENDSEVEIACPPTYSIITITDAEAEHMSTKSDSASAIFAKIVPAPVGYPGQFCGVMKLEQARRGNPVPGSSSSNNDTTTVGDYLHPNYLFTHTNFNPCLDEDKLDYHARTTRPGTQIYRSIEYADELADRAAEAPRTATEEALRREVHHESALARLEGVSVGEYRYYQGHLNIEEYKEAGMCVCWEACECAKMCTRFPDMLCPCSKYIEIHRY